MYNLRWAIRHNNLSNLKKEFLADELFFYILNYEWNNFGWYKLYNPKYVHVLTNNMIGLFLYLTYWYNSQSRVLRIYLDVLYLLTKRKTKKEVILEWLRNRLIIRWIRNGSEPYWKIIYSIVSKTIFYEY